MQPFDYVAVATADAAIHGAAGMDGVALIAGGTDLMQLMKEGAAAPRHLVDINALPCTEITVGGRVERPGPL
jgi:xanthine dehydrogenase YagS FAD-binding subunit